MDVWGFAQGSLPDFGGHLASAAHRWEKSSTPTKEAAVALLFMPPLPHQKEARLVLTRRTLSVSTHKGQISLAGGRREAGDLSVFDTAAREVEEEIGIPRKDLIPLGCLPPLISIDQSIVHPVLMASSVPDTDLLPAPDEVAELLLCPWTMFQRSASQQVEFQAFGIWRQSFLFETNFGMAWGLTAQILWECNLQS